MKKKWMIRASGSNETHRIVLCVTRGERARALASERVNAGAHALATVNTALRPWQFVCWAEEAHRCATPEATVYRLCGGEELFTPEVLQFERALLNAARVEHVYALLPAPIESIHFRPSQLTAPPAADAPWNGARFDSALGHLLEKHCAAGPAVLELVCELGPDDKNTDWLLNRLQARADRILPDALVGVELTVLGRRVWNSAHDVEPTRARAEPALLRDWYARRE